MVYYCKSCRYLFDDQNPCLEQCPDCGKKQVVKATPEQIDEYYKIMEDLNSLT